MLVQSSGLFKITILSYKIEIPELWTATKSAKVIGLTKLRGVLKTSCQGLLNGAKQKIPTVIFDFAVKA